MGFEYMRRSALLSGLVVALLLLSGCGSRTLHFQDEINTPEATYAKALALLESGALDAAEQALLQTIRLDADYAPAYVGMSSLYHKRGNIKEAIRYIHMARLRDVDYVPCWLMAARLFAAAGQYKAAVAEFREAIARDRNHLWAVESNYDLGKTLEKMEELEAAHDAYMEVIALDPLHLEARAAVGRIWKTLGPAFVMRLRFENRDIILP